MWTFWQLLLRFYRQFWLTPITTPAVENIVDILTAICVYYSLLPFTRYFFGVLSFSSSVASLGCSDVDLLCFIWIGPSKTKQILTNLLYPLSLSFPCNFYSEISIKYMYRSNSILIIAYIFHILILIDCIISYPGVISSN